MRHAIKQQHIAGFLFFLFCFFLPQRGPNLIEPLNLCHCQGKLARATALGDLTDLRAVRLLVITTVDP